MDNTQFQTLDYIVDYMVDLLPDNAGTVFEPTPGAGNLVTGLYRKANCVIQVKGDFFDHSHLPWHYDWVVMNPPFTPMEKGYRIFESCMELAPNIIALMPWLTIINSEKRTKWIMEFGLVSITHLPRSVFKGSRVQTCILEMKKGFVGSTEFRNFERKIDGKLPSGK